MVDDRSTGGPSDWRLERRLLSGLPGGRGLNMAHEAVDRHAVGPRATHVALRCIDRAGVGRSVTHLQLADRSSRFANVLEGLGVRPGERVFLLLPRTEQLLAAALGTLKCRAVVAPLFEALGPEPLRERLAQGGGRVLVTTPGAYWRTVAPIRPTLPGLDHVLVAGGGGAPPATSGLEEALAAAPPRYAIPATDPRDPALLHFTSGTTGTPKGALHPHRAVVSQAVTGRLVLNLHDRDVFWCTADPGWVTATAYGMVAPLVAGATTVVDEGGFDARRWYRILASERVTVWYTSPTALRMLRRAGPEAAAGHDLSALRLVATVGEALGPDVVAWARDVLGVPARDTWWQTETGAIMVADDVGHPRPGSMGRPVRGVEAAVLRRDRRGDLELDDRGRAVEVAAGEEGELALRPGWPSMFCGYPGQEDRYRECFGGGWYRSGDLVRRDGDGYLWFLGRADDVIESAGHLIGPAEVERCLLEHPAVAEAGVVGLPDPLAGEVVHAVVSLAPGVAPTDELRLELIAFARRHLGAPMAPRSIAFDQHLPHTDSGKILRRALRSRG